MSGRFVVLIAFRRVLGTDPGDRHRDAATSL